MKSAVQLAILLSLLTATAFGTTDPQGPPASPYGRVVILKIDGLNADLLYRTMREKDPVTGKSKLPWFSHIFQENGTIFENFYTRGISLSAPSWSILDTGQHAIIRGNVEYDRYTGRVYDYLNFFPFYIGYARKRQVDMPGVEVLDHAGVPLLIDRFPYNRRHQSFQLFQRGVRWTTLKAVLTLRMKSQLFLSPVESVDPPSFDALFGRQFETELKKSAEDPEVEYLDIFTGDIDHEAHATNQPAALLDVLRHLDALAGRLWTDTQSSPAAGSTLFVAISDHGINNNPDVFSQGFSLPDFFNSPAGGGHHVVTNRHQLSDFKIKGLDPLVQRVISPSTASFYLERQASHYPTAWLDLDGNERAALHLRNNDLNQIHILLQQLAHKDLSPQVRRAAAAFLLELVNRHRAAWMQTASQLAEELKALDAAESEAKADSVGKQHRWNAEEKKRGEDKQRRRDLRQLSMREREAGDYREYLARLHKLLDFKPDSEHPFEGKISDLIPEMELGDNNSVKDLQEYTIGPGPAELLLDSNGALDVARSFRHLNYFPLLLSQRVRNNPQAALSLHPIDFTAMRLPDGQYAFDEASAGGAGDPVHAYWLYCGEDSQLVIFTDGRGRISVRPVSHLSQNADGKIQWTGQPWRPGLPLHLFEDPALRVPAGMDPAEWLSGWHTDREWLAATHLCRYSNGVIGVTEELSPIEENVPGPPGINPILLRYERRRRALVTPDLHIFAADGWSFNARNFNPGGNHGSFLRISTHSVWMMAGPGIPVCSVSEPYDSLNFGSTILNLLGKPAPMPDRVVPLH